MLDRFKVRIHYSRKVSWLRLGRWLGGLPALLSLARIFYRLRVEGDENIPRQGGCLVAFNHVSTMADALLFLVVHRRRPDASLFVYNLSSVVIGDLLQAMGLPQAQEHILRAYDRQPMSVAGLLRARQTLLEGGCVAVTPEGEITWDGRLQSPLAPGAAWLALRSGVPVIPVVSLGGYDVQPLWQLEKTRLTGRICIRVGQPLVFSAQPLERVTDAQVQEASQRLWQALAALLKDQRR